MYISAGSGIPNLYLFSWDNIFRVFSRPIYAEMRSIGRLVFLVWWWKSHIYEHILMAGNWGTPPLHDMKNNLCHQNHFYRTHQRCHVLMGVPTLSYKALMISCWSTPTALSFHIFFEWVWKKTHGWLYNHYTPLHYIDLYLSYAHDNMCTKHYNPLP